MQPPATPYANPAVQPPATPYASPYAQPPASPYVNPTAYQQPAPNPYAQPYGAMYRGPYQGSIGNNPYAGPYANPYGAYPQAYGYAPFMKRPEAPSANQAMVVGIVSLVVGILLCTPVGLLGIVAVILGGRAKHEIKESRSYLDGRGKVTAALVTGWIAIAIGILGVLILILAFSSSGFWATV